MKHLPLRIISFLVTLTFCIGLLPTDHAKALSFAPTEPVASEAAVLLNMDLNTIVYEKNADMKEMPATLTQVMAAIVILESGINISGETITAEQSMFDPLSDYDYPTDLRYAGINAGDTLTVEDLLYAMLLTSSCEAAMMLSHYFGNGDESVLVEKMNEKAAALGMQNTRFTNVTGLYSARQVTTARDMIRMLYYAMSVPQFEKIACATNYTPANAETKGKSETWAWSHSNTMYDPDTKYYCPGVRGIKTGNLQEGGRAIACKASRDGNNYLLVCLNAPMYDENGSNHFYHLEDARTIVNWAFSHLTYEKVLTTNTEIDEVEVANADGSNYVILKPAEGYSCIWCNTMDINQVQRIITIDENVQAPIKQGQKLGTIQLRHSGEILAQIDLIAGNSVERSFWKYNLSLIPGFFTSQFLKIALLSALILTLLYVIVCIVFFVLYKKQKQQRPRRVSGRGSDRR
ncbi:MAG: D-alanyl-D-alanine carboxypeptidase [Oscillospiraceae bacterium]|nr:D-alanyl-D-alanine carboxypeptidase [Oscillospiraceae bacterium]